MDQAGAARDNQALTALGHPRLGLAACGEKVRVVFIEAAHGELDFRVASAGGYVSKTLTEQAARDFAQRWSQRRGGEDRYFVQSRIVGVTDWAEVEDDSAGARPPAP